MNCGSPYRPLKIKPKLKKVHVLTTTRKEGVIEEPNQNTRVYCTKIVWKTVEKKGGSCFPV